ncbi:MAG: metallophosphoesterase [Myxococcota bacterium]|nr:metallophosphoesterase [Myxococcota bacterium]
MGHEPLDRRSRRDVGAPLRYSSLAMALTVIVGDVHGCTAEVESLLDKVSFSPGMDRLVFVGDLILRGPDSRGALALARRLGARVVRGNHEQKLLARRTGDSPVSAEHARLAQELSRDEWAWLEATPHWIDLPAHGIRVVHAGVIPGITVDRVPPEALLRMRTLGGRNGWSDEQDAGPLWGRRYSGPPHVVFGHNARAEPQLHRWATGIDTGCVYGGRLTAVVLDEGEPMPRGKAARATLRSVPARRSYQGPRGKAPSR